MIRIRSLLLIVACLAILLLSFWITLAYIDLRSSVFGTNSSDACPIGNKTVLSPPYQHLGGYAYKAAVPSLRMFSDTGTQLFSSPSMLCEDEEKLGPPHSFHADIVKDGFGRFSHYEDEIVFSASDNSNPNSNGRQYTVVTPAKRK
jgi:hypothetical protein